MVPLDQYPKVKVDGTLIEAVRVLEAARKAMPSGRQPYQAVLVIDEAGRVVGKIGQLALLKALEPRNQVADDMDRLARAGVDDRSLNRALEHSRIFQQEFPERCLSAGHAPVKRFMHPVTEHIDEDALLCEAINSLVDWQTLSLLVTRGTEPVGLIRLSDMADEVGRLMRETADNDDFSS